MMNAIVPTETWGALGQVTAFPLAHGSSTVRRKLGEPTGAGKGFLKCAIARPLNNSEAP